MKRLIKVAALWSSPAAAQDNAVKEPVCQPTGRASKGDLVYSMAIFPAWQQDLLRKGERTTSNPNLLTRPTLHFSDQGRPLGRVGNAGCTDVGQILNNARHVADH